VPSRTPKRHYVGWILLALVGGALLWAATSDNPLAGALQELAGRVPDQTVLDSSFSIAPHSFRYYKFSLPQGSRNVAIVGQFGVSRVQAESHDQSDPEADHIEVYLLSEEAFADWQRGAADRFIFQSGKSSQGAVRAELPPGAGVYYLLFNNKFSPQTAKHIQARMMLRHRSWIPDWFRRKN
jgi:hypothetical protein